MSEKHLANKVANLSPEINNRLEKGTLSYVDVCEISRLLGFEVKLETCIWRFQLTFKKSNKYNNMSQ